MEKYLILQFENVCLWHCTAPLKPYLDSCPGSGEKSVETPPPTPPSRLSAFPPPFPSPLPFLSPANVRGVDIPLSITPSAACCDPRG